MPRLYFSPPRNKLMPAAAALLTTAFCGPVQALEPQSASARLTIVPTTATTASGDRRATFDFGQASLLDTLQIKHTFTLRNDGSAPLSVERLQASCGCTSAVALKTDQGSPAPPTVSPGAPLAILSPGEAIDVSVTVDLTHLAPGPQRKFVFIYGAGNTEPLATCEMKGRLLPSVELTPMPVDFGSVTAGEERTVTVTAVFDPRLASLSSTPMVSSNPAVRVALVPPNPPVPTMLDDSAGPRQPRRHYTYKVTVERNAPLGALLGVLWFPPVASAGPSGAAGQNLAEALASARITFVGEVVGDIAADPQTLAIGMAAHGVGVTRQILLTGRSADALENLRITSDSKWLSVRPITSPGTAATGTRTTKTLDVTIVPEAPAGIFQASLTIILANGQRLIVPVTSYIRP
jgi:hypothetical protein